MPTHLRSDAESVPSADCPASVSLLHQGVRVHAVKNANRPAFVHDEAIITYVDFYTRVCALAHTFVSHGVGRGDRIGLFAAKGIDVSVGLYAAMAAGAAYVPLDPQMPADRLAHIIDDCQIRVFVCDEARFKVLNRSLDNTRQATLTPAAEHNVVVAVGDNLACENQFARMRVLNWTQVNEASATGFPKVTVLPSDLAYIMYTSGSTGLPKGLMHTHASGLAYARLSVDLYSLSEHDRLANMAPLHFDMSTLEYLAAPLAGACTVIVSEECARFPASVTDLMQRERITVWYSVPHAMVQLLHYGALDKRDLSHWRWMLLGGERVPRDDVSAIMQRLPSLRVVNVYGPAEVNQCTHYELPRPLPASTLSVPIGQPWPDTEALVVDEDMVAVPAGEPGELLIRTTTMMQGYWGRPDLNARVFHTIEQDGGFTQCFLRTGDLVRQDEQGQLLFLGRRDRQIKLRGYRIELDEIETVINGHPGVEEVAVVLVEHPQHGARIVARLTQVDNEICDLKSMKKRMMSRLPRYAIPTDIALIDEFPRTTSLKINRRALANNIESAFDAGTG